MAGQPERACSENDKKEPAWKRQLQNILGRKNMLDLFEDQRGGHWREDSEGRRGSQGGRGPGHMGSAGQGKTSRFTFLELALLGGQ